MNITNLYTHNIITFLFCLFTVFGISQEIDLISLNQLMDSKNSGKTIKINKSFNLNGATIKIANGIILKPQGGIFYNGFIDGNNYTILSNKVNKIFHTDIVFKTRYTKDFLPEWYGARGDGSTNDTGAFVKAINSSSKIRLRKYRTYLFKETLRVNRIGSIEIIGNGAKIITNGFSEDPVIYFDKSFDNVVLKDFEIDGENNTAAGIWVSSNFTGNNLILRNFYNRKDTAYGIHFEMDKAEEMRVLLERSVIDNVRGLNNGTIGTDGIGTSRAVRIYWRESFPGSKVVILNNKLTNVIGEDADVIQVAQNNNEYSNDTRTIIQDNYIAFGTRRLIKASASNVKVIGNTFKTFPEGNNKSQTNNRLKTYMVAFQPFEPRLGKNEDFVLGAVAKDNIFESDANAESFGNGGTLGLIQTKKAVIVNNQFTNSLIVLGRFNQNAIVSSNTLINSTISIGNSPVIYNQTRITRNKAIVNFNEIKIRIFGFLIIHPGSIIEDLKFDNNSVEVTEVEGKNLLGMIHIPNSSDTKITKIEILNNTLKKNKVGGFNAVPRFLNSFVPFSRASRIQDNRLITDIDKPEEGIVFDKVSTPITFSYSNNITSFGKEMIPRNTTKNLKKKNLMQGNSEDKLSINIYPNPVVDKLHIQSTSGPTNYIIKNFLGQTVKKGKLLNSIINTDMLTPGNYFIHIQNESLSESIQFVKK